LDDMAPVHSKPIFQCPHAMHEGCVAKWICTNFTMYGLVHTVCPYCRASIRLPLPDNIHKVVQESLAESIGPRNRAFVGLLLERNFDDAFSLAVKGADVNLALKVMLFRHDIYAAEALVGLGARIGGDELPLALGQDNLGLADWLVAHRVPISDTLWNSVSSVSGAKWLSDHHVRISASALEKALESQYFDVADFLVSYGVPAGDQQLPSFLRSKNFAAAEWLFKHYKYNGQVVERELQMALERNDVKAADLLVLHANSLIKSNLLECAIERGNFEKARWLVDHGAAVRIEVLEDAIEREQLEKATLFIEYGVSVNSELWFRVTDNIAVAQWLLEHQVPMNDDALKVALSRQHFKLAEWLIGHGLSVKDAWDRAVELANFDTAKWLFENHRACLPDDSIREAMRYENSEIAHYLYEKTSLFEQHPVLVSVVAATSGVAVAGGILFAIIRHLNRR